MTIYADGRIPYFYIIEHKETKIKYAGAKWGKDANPDTFMSSKVVSVLLDYDITKIIKNTFIKIHDVFVEYVFDENKWRLK